MVIGGVNSAGVLMSIFILIIICYNRDSFHVFKYDSYFTLYILISAFSVVFYLFNGRGIKLFFQGVSYTLIPSLLYLLGAKRARSYESSIAVSKDVIMASVTLMVIGLVFYYLFPEFYYSHIGQSLDTSHWGIEDYRYGSYISSSNLGSLCVASICLFFLTLNTRNKFFNVIFIITILVSLLMCMQRSAWVMSGIFLTILLLVTNNTRKTKIGMAFLAIFALFVIIEFSNKLFNEYQLEMFLVRTEQLNAVGMASERSSQWKNGLSVFMESPMGYGLGSMGHKAAQEGYKGVVPDGNYFRILSELGIFGFIVFILLIIRSLRRGLKTKNIELTLLILGYCAQAIGTNVFDLYFSSFVFWYILGYLNHTKVVSVRRDRLRIATRGYEAGVGL